MPKLKQLTIPVENRPGSLAHVAQVLGDAKVNITAFFTGASGTNGWVQVIVDNANKAKKSLGAAGLSFTEEEVLHVQLPNLPGTLARFAGKLAAKGINITCGYATTLKGPKKGSIVLAVSDVKQAARIR